MDTHSKDQDHLTIVLGGAGKTGSRVIRDLTAAGVRTRAGSRSSDPPFDWEDRDTWEAALAGADAAYVAYHPDLAVPGADAVVGSLAGLAAGLGVRRLVLLSGRGEDGALVAEDAVRAAFPGATVVRCSWFNQNFSEGEMLDPLIAGELALPVGAVREPFVDCDDIAAVAVAALTGDGHAGETYELTGPRLLSFADAVAEIAAATGRRLTFAEVSVDDYAAVLADAGVPVEAVELLRFLFTEVLDGRNASLTDGVQRALGREPRDFRDFARAEASRGAWDADRQAATR